MADTEYTRTCDVVQKLVDALCLARPDVPVTTWHLVQDAINDGRELLAALPSASLGEQREPDGWKLVGYGLIRDGKVVNYSREPGKIGGHESTPMYITASPASKGAGVTAAPRCGSHECKAGQQDGVLCADGECDRESGVRSAGLSADQQEQSRGGEG